jgi:hypothetical protein
MVYEYVTVSDPITFIAENDAIAWITATLLGQGLAGCTREDGKSIDSMTAFAPENKRSEIYKQYIGTDDILGYVKEHGEEIATCLLSFAYGNNTDRKQYDFAISCITDTEKLKQFKEQHEDLQRTSMSRHVASAWKLGEIIRKKYSTNK